MTHCNIFDSRCFSKKGKTQKLSLLWSNMIQNVFFYCSFFSKCRHFFKNFFHSIFDTFYFLIRKSDASWNCLCKNKLFKVIQDRSNRSILLSNVIQNKIFRKQTFFEFRHKTLMHWTFFFNSCIPKKQGKCKKMSFSRSNMIDKVTFWMQTFLNFWHVFKRLVRNLTPCLNFFRNLTHCVVLNIKSCFSKEHEKGKKCRFTYKRFSVRIFEKWIF